MLGCYIKPKFYYDRSLIEYNELGEQVSIESEKNNQPMFISNWFGGQKDHRDAVVGLDGRPRALFENHLLYLFPEIPCLENIFRNKYVDYATHIFDSFGQDRGELLKRKNFCPDQSNYFSELFRVLLPVHELVDEEINYVERVDRNNTTYLHQISKVIEHELPGVQAMDVIGPFSSDEESCKDFSWLKN